MASGLALSGIVAFGLFSSVELASLFFEIQVGRVIGLNILGWSAIFAPLGLVSDLIVARVLGRVAVKGRKTEIMVYELLGITGSNDPELAVHRAVA
jgi:hypothetical protein